MREFERPSKKESNTANQKTNGHWRAAARTGRPKHEIMGPAGANQQNLAYFFFCAAGLVLINNTSVEFFFVTTSRVVELRWQQGTPMGWR
jgi:hypothetical protein